MLTKIRLSIIVCSTGTQINTKKPFNLLYSYRYFDGHEKLSDKKLKGCWKVARGMKWSRWNEMKQREQNEAKGRKWSRGNEMKQMEQNEADGMKWSRGDEKLWSWDAYFCSCPQFLRWRVEDACDDRRLLRLTNKGRYDAFSCVRSLLSIDRRTVSAYVATYIHVYGTSTYLLLHICHWPLLVVLMLLWPCSACFFFSNSF